GVGPASGAAAVGDAEGADAGGAARAAEVGVVEQAGLAGGAEALAAGRRLAAQKAARRIDQVDQAAPRREQGGHGDLVTRTGALFGLWSAARIAALVSPGRPACDAVGRL